MRETRIKEAGFYFVKGYYGDGTVAFKWDIAEFTPLESFGNILHFWEFFGSYNTVEPDKIAVIGEKIKFPE